jgi:hypothetical protein
MEEICMKKSKKLLWGLPVLALVFGMTVLSAKAKPKVVDMEVPDEKSAVVYFFGSKIPGGALWDGLTPIGDFGDGPMISKMSWKTTPGEHYFMANTFNFVVMKANLEPNKRYYVQLLSIPNPIPFGKDFIAMRVLTPEAGEEFIKSYKKTIAFDDKWRAGYAQGKHLKEATEHLEKAQNNNSLDTDLK